ncbi:MAG TPA: hypothetical protein VNW25_05015 [Candidatus Sulfotelmatobacter sp.]|nr:hypothetical protein [Candidatus Sulfotelmatobacter sp.]
MRGKRFENAIKISSAPAETVAFLVPYYAWYEKDVNGVEAFWPKVLGLRLRNIEISRREFFPEVFELGEEEVNVSFLHNRNKNPPVAIQGLSDQRPSIDLTTLADVACYTPRADILIEMQDLIHYLHALLFYISNRLPFPEA